MPVSDSRSTGAVRTLCIAGVVLVLVATAVPTALWWVGHRAVARVSATTGVPQCHGTEPTVVDSDGFGRAAIPLSEGFVCALTIKVTNRSDHEVGLEQIVVPAGGPRGGAAFEVTHISGMGLPADDEIDAVIDLGLSVAAGAEQLVKVGVAFRESGCTARGLMWIEPTIVVSDLLASHELIVADLPVFLGTADSWCGGGRTTRQSS